MDPLTLSSIGAETLKQGIKFLYAQAGEVLRRWRERRDGGSDDDSVVMVEAGRSALELEPKPLLIDYALLERLEPGIRTLSAALEEYATADGSVAAIENLDPSVLKVTDGLRSALEAVLGQSLTLRGEQRADPGHDFEVVIDAERVGGYIAGIVAEDLEGTRIRVSIKAVDSNAKIIGFTNRGGGLPPLPGDD